MPKGDALREMLAVAVNAPSGDNAQPWEFAQEGDALLIFNKAHSDVTLYNFKQRGSYVAHGALIENIALLAARAGFATTAELFPAGAAGSVARLTFAPGAQAEEALCAAIPARTTNRKPYRPEPLREHERTALLGATTAPEPQVLLVEERAAVAHIARALSLNERLLMENRPIHDLLFSMIRFSPQEETRSPGLYIKTMELPPPVQLLFRYVLRAWPMVRLLGFIGFPKAISRQTAALYGSSAAFALISTQSLADAAFVETGRALERLWLTATALGLSLQPVTALPYLAQRIAEGEAQALSREHQGQIVSAVGEISAAAGVPAGRHITMIVRIGRADAPSAHSRKSAPVLRAAR